MKTTDAKNALYEALIHGSWTIDDLADLLIWAYDKGYEDALEQGYEDEKRLSGTRNTTKNT